MTKVLLMGPCKVCSLLPPPTSPPLLRGPVCHSLCNHVRQSLFAFASLSPNFSPLAWRVLVCASACIPSQSGKSVIANFMVDAENDGRNTEYRPTQGVRYHPYHSGIRGSLSPFSPFKAHTRHLTCLPILIVCPAIGAVRGCRHVSPRTLSLPIVVWPQSNCGSLLPDNQSPAVCTHSPMLLPPLLDIHSCTGCHHMRLLFCLILLRLPPGFCGTTPTQQVCGQTLRWTFGMSAGMTSEAPGQL